MKEPLFSIQRLVKAYKQTVALNNVSLGIYPGTTLGIVGESGSGKSTLGRCVLHLDPPTSGDILYKNKSLYKFSKKELLAFRRQAQIIFQDPYSSLNPRMTAGEIIAEPLKIHHGAAGQEYLEELALQVGLSPYLLKRFPHEFSGGQRQRIGIARALALKPSFIVCDEPISALDVPIQAQILNLLKELQKKLGLTYLFITHNLQIVPYLCDEVAVLYQGHLVEKCPASSLHKEAKHPYTQELLAAIPSIEDKPKSSLPLITQEKSSSGCPFAPRCPHVHERCWQENPQLTLISHRHTVACHLYTQAP